MTKETKKSILYSIAFSPIFLGGLLLVFGYASDLYSQEKLYAIVKVGVVVVLSVFVTASLVFYNKQAYDQNPDSLYKIDPRFVDHVLIVSLWFFGAIGVLFIDRALHLEIYFQTITALAVMYVLLVAFRIDRLVRRTAEEEELTLDLMGKALYWRTIYKRDVEAVIGPWRGLSGYREKIENLVIAKKEKHLKKLAEKLAKKTRKELPEEFAKNPLKEIAEIFGEKYAKELTEQFVKGFNAQTSTALADMFFADIAEKLVQEYAKKTPEELAEILEEKKKEKDQSSNIKYISSFGMNKEVVEEFAKELAKKFEEPSKEFEETKKENFRDRINDECAANLLAAKVMTDVMEKIDKDESEEELINAYRFSIMSINLIEEWEIEKANRPAQEIHDAKLQAKVKKEEEEEAKLQELEKEKDNHQEKSDERIVKLREFQTDFTKFINSRQQGNNPSELIAIGAIGLALVALMNLGVPREGFTEYGAFYVHLFTLFTSTIVVFLFFNILDLENDRHRSLHDVVPGYFGPDFSSKLWKEVVHYNYRPPSKKWIYIVSLFTTIFYVLLWLDAYLPHYFPIR